jgi:hypothetical protein
MRDGPKHAAYAALHHDAGSLQHTRALSRTHTGSRMQTGIAKSRTVVLADLEHVLQLPGIQFGFALQNANVSRIFQTSARRHSLLWIAAPLTGLLVQRSSATCPTALDAAGRRRPYFWSARC